MEISKQNFNYQNYQPNFSGLNVKSVKQVTSEVAKSVGSTGDISGQTSCWKLYKPEVLETFIKSDKEMAEPLADVFEMARTYGLNISIDMLRQLRRMKPEVEKFFDIVKTKYNIDLDIPPKVYRFVGQSEVDALKTKGIVHPQRGYSNNFDVTLNPDLNWNDYRITFKPKKEFSVLDNDSKIKENFGRSHDYFYHYAGSYTIDDVETIERYRP